MKLFIFQFIESLNTSFGHSGFVLAENVDQAREYLKTFLDLSNKYDAYLVKSIDNAEYQEKDLDKLYGCFWKSQC